MFIRLLQNMCLQLFHFENYYNMLTAKLSFTVHMLAKVMKTSKCQIQAFHVMQKNYFCYEVSSIILSIFLIGRDHMRWCSRVFTAEHFQIYFIYSFFLLIVHWDSPQNQ